MKIAKMMIAIYFKQFNGILNLYNNKKQQLTGLQAIEEEHRKENGELRKELEQEKEKNKELDSEIIRTRATLNEVIKDYVSKDKIKEKIEYYKRLLNEDNWGEKTELGFKNRVVALQELLEEE